MWDEACRAQSLSESFNGIADHIANNTASWRVLYDAKTPQTLTDFPEPWQSKLTFFQRMIMLRVLRPDKVVHAVRSFVEDNIGRRFVEPPPFDLVKVGARAHPRTHTPTHPHPPTHAHTYARVNV
jgi:dynein heavy chain